MSSTGRRILGVAVVAAMAATCGGGGDSGARPVVIPQVPAGDREADCMALCSLLPTQTVCTATHAEFCLSRCRAATHDLPAACADCILAQGAQIQDDIRSADEQYCWVSGPADLSTCAACDDAGAAAPSPDLEVQCQLACGFYTGNHVALACSDAASADCLTACRALIAAQDRVCAQCVIEQTIPGRSCINDDCDCAITFNNSVAGLTCRDLCDTMPPAIQGGP
jgi:hypothetical protein